MAGLHTHAKQQGVSALLKQKFALYREPAEIGCMRKAPVFELVKTLSPADLKMLRKRTESNTSAYIGLLDILVDAPKNNEVDFKKAFESTFKGVDYIETKSYLYKFLLRHLTSQEPGPNSFAQINYSFCTAEMLFSRGLTDEAISVYKQANKLALEEGFYQLSIVAIRRIKNLKLKTMRNARDYQEIKQLHEEEISALKNDRDVSEAMMLYTDFLQLTEKYGGPVNKTIAAQFEKLMQAPLVKNRAKVESKQARIILFDLVTNHYRLFGKEDLFTDEYREELQRYTAQLLRNPYYAYRYIFMLHNLTVCKISAEELKMYSGMLAKAPTPDSKTGYYKQLFTLHARLAGPVKSDVAINTLLKDVQLFLKDVRMADRPRERFNLLTGIVAFLLDYNYCEQAEEILVTALNDKQLEDVLQAEFVSLRLFYLATLFKLRKYDAMEPAIRATRYVLKTRGLENNVSVKVLALFGYLMRNATATKLKATKQQLADLLTDVPNFSFQQWGIYAFLHSNTFNNLLK